jgi:hypothetical protein
LFCASPGGLGDAQKAAKNLGEKGKISGFFKGISLSYRRFSLRK